MLLLVLCQTAHPPQCAFRWVLPTEFSLEAAANAVQQLDKIDISSEMAYESGQLANDMRAILKLPDSNEEKISRLRRLMILLWTDSPKWYRSVNNVLANMPLWSTMTPDMIQESFASLPGGPGVFARLLIAAIYALPRCDQMVFRGQENDLDEGGCRAQPLDKPRFVTIGDSRLYKTFLSFTTNEDVARDFAMEHPSENAIIIELPAPHDGCDLMYYSAHAREEEVLMLPLGMFTNTRVECPDGKFPVVHWVSACPSEGADEYDE